MAAVLSSPLARRLALHAAALQPGRPLEERQHARQALSGLLDEMTAAAGEHNTCTAAWVVCICSGSNNAAWQKG